MRLARHNGEISESTKCPNYVGVKPMELKTYKTLVEIKYNRSEFDMPKREKLQDDHRCYQEVNLKKPYGEQDLIKIDMSLINNKK